MSDDVLFPTMSINQKESDLCATLVCECGCRTHFDAMGLYVVKCRLCGKSYEIRVTVTLHDVTPRFNHPEARHGVPC